ncbi:hypothetical protein [Ancylomarina longa]|uniref:Uncharacterized protein n=1 Tax=Ancylomarina longa TaxID=2487017 RepID=A0A434AYM5_9BACT|nr:hypothetical protein [Ancylomarina longa]RUT79565.1 hypothetical protein DLK05_02420 [Ancylomarina longa]
MNYKTEPYNELVDSLSKHDIDLDQEVYFVPENIFESKKSSDFVYSETTSDIRKVFRKENVPINYLTEDKPLLRSRKGADWFGPTLLFGFSVLINNPHVIGVSLNLVSSYLYDFFKGKIGDKSVKFEVVVECKKKKEYKKINYEGSVEGIPELEKIIKALKP